MKLADAIDAWVERMSSTHMESTVVAYRKDAIRFMRWIGEEASTELSIVSIEDYDDHLRRAGASLSARQRAFYALFSLFSFLRKRGHPISGEGDPSRPRGSIPRREPIPSTVMSTIVSNEDDVMHRAFLSTLAGTGARLGEVLALDASDVNLEDGTVVISGEKGAGRRIIPLAPSTIEVLGEYIPRRRMAKDGDPLFVTRVGTRMSERSARSVWKTALERIGAPGGFCIHQIRHRYGTDVVAAGGLDVGQALLGHRSPSSTMRYSHPSMDRMRDAVAGR